MRSVSMMVRFTVLLLCVILSVEKIKCAPTHVFSEAQNTSESEESRERREKRFTTVVNPESSSVVNASFSELTVNSTTTFTNDVHVDHFAVRQKTDHDRSHALHGARRERRSTENEGHGYDTAGSTDALRFSPEVSDFNTIDLGPRSGEALLDQDLDLGLSEEYHRQPQSSRCNIRTPESESQEKKCGDRNVTCPYNSSYGEWCGDGRCYCCDCVANCSKTPNGEAHIYIPSFDLSITVLDFSGNGLKEINDSYFFENATHFEHVDLSFNELRSIDRGAFSSLRNLSVLLLNDNLYLDLTTHGDALFNLSSVQVLDVSNVYSGTFPSNLFHGKAMPSLHKLILNGADLRRCNASMFQQFPSLQYLNLAMNDMRSIATEFNDTFENLTILHLEQNDMNEFPTSCLNSSEGLVAVSVYPNLQELYVNDNRISSLTSEICFPKLLILYLSCNPIVNILTNMFGENRFPKLSVLHMENLEIELIESYAFNNTKLAYVSLMYNNVDFVTEHIHEEGFAGLPRLSFLQLEHNYLNNDRFIQLFGGLTNLQRVYVGNTNLDTVTKETFSSFRGLKVAKLHRNFFWRIPDGVFDGFQNLTTVDLSNCRITTIGENTFSNDTRRRLKTLDLSGNHFHCDCDLLWFRDWLGSNDSIFYSAWTAYKCSNLPKTNVTDFRMNKQVCLMSRDASVFTVVVVTLLMIILMLVTFFFRYRWTIRLILYEAFRGKGHNCRLPADYFRYDVFVSYAEQDLNWVRHHLISELEVGMGVRLCIHQRDFLPGENIVDNIFHSVKDSRKVMMVFSRHFARSQWCQFELAMCLNHVIHNDDALLIACVDDVTCSTELTPTMMAVLNTTTYIQWAEEDDAIASFWARMRIALRDVIPRRRQRTSCNHVHVLS
ncbi:toll-like receptor 2 [Littorina saxatilis]|uniref:TIR domain-containing protein n=1 Tax=Littorina saxatilis TaxID=31220 RepID=A0AAN9BYS2_9CAEN